MRIYAVADIHGRLERIALIRDRIKQYEPDLLVVAGDITRFGNAFRAVARLNDLSVPVFTVRGNADRSKVDQYIEDSPGISSLHLKTLTLKGIDFVGVSGAIPVPFRTRICFREKRILERVDSLVNEHSVFVAHPPPFGILDEVLGRYHAGSKALYDLISRKQPRLMICGHIHERPNFDYIGKTLIVNCNMGRKGSGALIEMDGMQGPQVTML